MTETYVYVVYIMELNAKSKNLSNFKRRDIDLVLTHNQVYELESQNFSSAKSIP